MGTNELIGEDPSVIIRIDASQVMVRLDVASGTIHCTFGFYCSEHALGEFSPVSEQPEELQRVCVLDRAFPTCLCDQMLLVVVLVL